MCLFARDRGCVDERQVATVREMATKAVAMGILLSPARMTADGFYEAVISYPDGNPVEITE
ncbi:Hypothetical protein NGAL_HAMBI2610_51810 [Neorhizobium galegae bv. orientalis]|nr:Hypothetical protein NGAL_HAMBI2610_51810 [Neorhizobium galegae bv. orientalis]